MTRYPFIWLMGLVNMCLGVLVWLLTALAFCLLLTATPVYYMPGTANWLSDLLFQITAGLRGLGSVAVVIYGFVGGLSLLASGQLLWMLLDWAEDTRLMRMLREKDELERQLRRGGRP